MVRHHHATVDEHGNLDGLPSDMKMMLQAMMTVEERNNPEKFNEKKAIQALFFQKKEQGLNSIEFQ